MSAKVKEQRRLRVCIPEERNTVTEISDSERRGQVLQPFRLGPSIAPCGRIGVLGWTDTYLREMKVVYF